MAVALMTRGPLTAYSIFLMQGFMLSMVTVAAAEDMLEVLGKFFRETKSLCLKLMMLHKFWETGLGRRQGWQLHEVKLVRIEINNA